MEENFQALQSPYTSGKLCGYAERPNTKLTFSKYTARHKKMLANSSSVHEQSEEKLALFGGGPYGSVSSLKKPYILAGFLPAMK